MYTLGILAKKFGLNSFILLPYILRVVNVEILKNKLSGKLSKLFVSKLIVLMFRVFVNNVSGSDDMLLLERWKVCRRGVALSMFDGNEVNKLYLNTKNLEVGKSI